MGYAYQAADLARSLATRSGPTGCFEVLHSKVAVRGGPSTGAPIVASARCGRVLRGTPHSVDGHPWLFLDHAALKKVRAGTGDHDASLGGWILMDGEHLGLGPLMAPTE